MNDPLSFALVESIREVVDRNTRRTPLIESRWLSELTGGRVHLKCENLQRTGSFKVRGGFAALALDRPEVAVAASAGNHGQGLALAARELGIPCTVVVPRTVPGVKAAAIARHGAKVIKAPSDGYDGTESWMREHLEELGAAAAISAFDHPGVIAGNGGTTALEIFEELDDLDALVIPCGGGGCSVGAGLVARERSPGTRVVAVNSDASPGMWMSRRDGRAHLSVESGPTVAEGIEGGVSERSFAYAEEYVDDVVVAREQTIRRAVGELAFEERLIAEGSGAAGVAALLDGLVKHEKVCVVLTGANIDPALLVELLQAGSPRR